MSRKRIFTDMGEQFDELQDEMNDLHRRQSMLISEVETVQDLAKKTDEEFERWKCDHDHAKAIDDLEKENTDLKDRILKLECDLVFTNKAITTILVGMQSGAALKDIANLALNNGYARDRGIFDGKKFFEELFSVKNKEVLDVFVN